MVVASKTPPDFVTNDLSMARGFKNLDFQSGKHVLVTFLVRSKDEVWRGCQSDCAHPR